MKKKLFYIIPLALFVALLIGLAVFANSNSFEHIVLGKINDKSSRHIEANDSLAIEWGWPITSLNGKNIKLANFDQGTDPYMLTVESLHVSIDWRQALKGDILLPEIILDSPILLLEKDKDGNANWQFKENPGANATWESITPDERSEFPGIGKLVIRNGKLKYKDSKKKTDIDLVVDTITGQAKETERLHFAGKGTYRGGKFLMDIKGGNVFQLQEGDDPYPILAEVTAGGTVAKLSGTMLDPLKFKGMDTQLELKGANAAELFDLVGIALPPTPPYNVKGQLNYRKDVWHFNGFKGRMGDSDLSGSVAWDKTKKRPRLTGTFISNNLDFDDLGGFIGATPSTRGGETASATQKRKAQQAEASPFIIPDAPLDISRLKAMDADVSFTGKKLISNNLPLDDFFMQVDLDDSLLKINPVRFGTARGDIKAFLTVNARQEPVKINGDFRFRKLMLKPIFEKLSQKLNIKNVTEGYIGGAAKLAGTGKSLRQMLTTANGNIGLGMERGQISNLIIELLGLDVAQGLGLYVSGDKPVRVRCLIGDFAVKTGVMQVRYFVLDTTDTNVTGKGHINLKDETLDMTLYAAPKDTSILSLNSPISLKGTLKKPNVNLNLGKVAGRGLAATALAVLFPPAAIAAFIEPGLGKDSDCAKLVNETRSRLRKQGQPNLVPKNK